MKTRPFIALLAALLCLASCVKPEEPQPTPAPEATVQRTIVYAVDADESRQSLASDAEWDALLDRFCNYAAQGHAVTFYSKNTPAQRKAVGEAEPKDITTFSTTDRQAMKEWMKQMEKEGRTINIVYDADSGTWSGTAYATLAVGPAPQQHQCHTGVITSVPIPAITDPALPGLVQALQVSPDSLLIIADGGAILVLDGPSDYTDGETLTLCGVVSVETDLYGTPFYILDISASDPSTLVGSWHYSNLSTTLLNQGDWLLQTTLQVPELSGESLTLEFLDDGSAVLTRLDLASGLPTTESASWTLTDDELCCTLLDPEASCWTVGLLSPYALVLTRLVDDTFYQLEFTPAQ